LQVGRCTWLSGSQQFLALEPLDFSSLPDGFSISFWFRHEPVAGTDSSNTKIFNFGNGPSVGNIVFGKNGSTADAIFQIYTSPTEYHSETIRNGFVADTWMHYVCVVQRTGSLSNWTVYQNGVRVLQAKRRYYPRAATNLNYIGKSNWPSEPYFVGSIDSLGVFPWPLKDAHATSIFRQGKSMVSFLAQHSLQQDLDAVCLFGML
jgi:hypothetical protein